MSATRSRVVRRARRTNRRTAAVATVALGMTGGLAIIPDFSAGAPGQASAQQAPGDKPVRVKAFDRRHPPRDFTVVDGTVYFVATTRAKGTELWRTDGTPGGTTLVKNLRGGGASSDPAELTAVGDTLFFTAAARSGDRELWKSDGTAAGTTLVKDIRPGQAGSDPRDLTLLRDTVFFSSSDGARRRELWKSDGTRAGTTMVRDVRPGAGHSRPEHLTPAVGQLFFATSTGDLWKTDGTRAGTELVADFADVDNLTWTDDTLFFSADDGVRGAELWKSDGTPAGTTLLREINPAVTYSEPDSSDPGGFTSLGDEVVFAATSDATGRELWKTDGTEAGTVEIKDINTGNFDGGYYLGNPPHDSDPSEFTATGDELVFSAGTDDPEDNPPGRELWRTDGTTRGTVMVRDLNPGSGRREFYGYNYPDPFNGLPRGITPVDGTMFFSAFDDGEWINPGVFNEQFAIDKNNELWRSDGTRAGTMRVADLRGQGSSSPHDLTAVGETLYFAARDGKDTASVYRVGPPQPNSFSITKGKVDRRNGELTLKVRVPTRGVVRLDPHNGSPVKRKRVTVGKAGTAKVVLKLKRQGRAELRRQLRKGKTVARVEVRLRMSFAPSSGGDDGVKVRKFAVERKRR